MKTLVERAQFLSMVRTMPLVSVDLMLVRGGREVLLCLRKRRPGLGYWFVPGSRVFKNERNADALARVARRELGVNLADHRVAFVGPFEQIFTDCFVGEVGVTTHYVVLAHRVDVPAGFELDVGSGQLSALRWWPIGEAARDPMVHEYSRAYLL